MATAMHSGPGGHDIPKSARKRRPPGSKIVFPNMLGKSKFMKIVIYSCPSDDVVATFGNGRIRPHLGESPPEKQPISFHHARARTGQRGIE